MKYSPSILCAALCVWTASSSGYASGQDAPSEAPADVATTLAAEQTPAPTSPAAAAPEPAMQGPAKASATGPVTTSERGLSWTGPRVELGYRIYSLTDDAGGGAVSSATFSGFLPTRFVRAGGGLEAGGRGYEYGATEGLFSGNAFVGYQHLRDLGRMAPYVVAVGELGFVLGKRFHTPRTNLIRGAGVEIGADVNVVRSFYLGLGLGYMVYSLDDLAYNSFGLRLSAGL